MIETSRKLLRVLLENMIIPAIVGTEDLDEAVKLLKEGAVHYVRRRFGADIDLAALHFGKSTRWIYRVLAKRETETTRSGRRAADDEPGEESNGSGGQCGYALMESAVRFYLQKSPQAFPPSACARALRREGFDVNAFDLGPLLDMYCGMGYLTKTIEQTGGSQEIRYLARDGNLTAGSAENQGERLARVGTRSKLIFPIARAYVEGTPHTYFREMTGSVLPEEYQQLSRVIRDTISQAVADAVARSLEKDPEESIPRVHFRGLYLMGLGPWSEPFSNDENRELNPEK